LRLISNKVISRSYGYFLKYSYFNFLRNWIFQLCQKLQSLVQKTQGILGVNVGVFWWVVIWIGINLCGIYRVVCCILTPKGPRPFFDLFLKFRQANVDTIFVPKISNFRWTCGIVLTSRIYKIPISNLGVMPQKQNYFEIRAARVAKKLFIF
jgi:hypothetical protein